jgi:hypothetical protein
MCLYYLTLFIYKRYKSAIWNMQGIYLFMHLFWICGETYGPEWGLFYPFLPFIGGGGGVDLHLTIASDS